MAAPLLLGVSSRRRVSGTTASSTSARCYCIWLSLLFNRFLQVSQYIGEIARYLLAQPEKPTDRRHRVWLMFGNGLRPKFWREFCDRFNIKRVGEFYGSTEGNSNIGERAFSFSFASLIYSEHRQQRGRRWLLSCVYIPFARSAHCAGESR